MNEAEPRYVLCVEDNKAHTEIIKIILDGLGVPSNKIFTAPDLEAADLSMRKLEELGATDPLVLLDLDLNKRETGLRFLHDIKGPNSVYRNSVVVVMSVERSPDVKQACLVSGASDYIEKPYEVKEVERVIRKYLYQDHGERSLV